MPTACKLIPWTSLGVIVLYVLCKIIAVGREMSCGAAIHNPRVWVAIERWVIAVVGCLRWDVAE